MPRRRRINIHGGIYHVMSRGNRKGVVFTDDRERKRFGRILGEVTVRCAVRCYSGCLMDNHYHLVVMTPWANLPTFTKLLNQRFTQYMNRRHGWTGHVFESRPTALLIDSDFYLLDALAYVARNPVAAGIVTEPAHWRWSTYASTIGRAAVPDWLTLDWLDRFFPDMPRAAARERFRAYVMSAVVGDEVMLTGDPAIGGEEFRRRVRSHIGATLYKARLPRSYRALCRPSLQELFEPVTDKSQRGRVIQRAHVVHGYRLAEIANFLTLHPNSVSRILGQLRRNAAKRLRSKE
jgi:REP element-mobilizing transposase RayT